MTITLLLLVLIQGQPPRIVPIPQPDLAACEVEAHEFNTAQPPQIEGLIRLGAMCARDFQVPVGPKV